MPYFSEISPLQAAEMMRDYKDAWVLDARDASSYKEGHIDGAMQAHDGLVSHLLNKEDFARPVIIYCYRGNSSKKMAEVFARAGYERVYSMIGGFVAWKKRDSLYSTKPYADSTNEWLQMSGFEQQALGACIEGQTTPLILACRQGNVDMVREFIGAGADLEHINSDGNTALWAACYGDHLAIINLLLGAGANINHQNGDGISVLIYAASASKTEVVDLLVKRGADTGLKTSDDFTALDLAANAAILKILKAKSAQPA
jgi:uncharacterized protein